MREDGRIITGRHEYRSATAMRAESRPNSGDGMKDLGGVMKLFDE